jgi:hypothetical protein
MRLHPSFRRRHGSHASAIRRRFLRGGESA